MDLAAVRALALALPETIEAPHFDAVSFRVRGRIFLTVPAGGTHLHLFVAEEARALALALHPAMLEPLSWGARVVGLRLPLAGADADVVAGLVRQAWRHKAPRRLVEAAGPG